MSVHTVPSSDSKAMSVALIGNGTLRSAIRRNLVSFPSQIPTLVKHGDLQERVVLLYFVRGWQMRAICDRYGLSKSTVQKLILEWKIRAVSAGYIQEIHPKELAALASHEAVDPSEVPDRQEPDTGFAAWDTAPLPRPARLVSDAVRV
jgi:hypothetical protein